MNVRIQSGDSSECECEPVVSAVAVVSFTFVVRVLVLPTLSNDQTRNVCKRSFLLSRALT